MRSVERNNHNNKVIDEIWFIIIIIKITIINHKTKQVIALEMSCPWIGNREKKSEEKTLKNRPLTWDLRQRGPGYQVQQCNIIMETLGG